MEIEKNERVLVLGGRRGLGAALVAQFKAYGAEAFSISRKSELKADFAKAEDWCEIVAKIRELSPRRILYCAAGGPYGDFSRFEWKDHQWALRVSFEFPGFLLHSILQTPIPQLEQIVVVGSSVAEAKADPGAASYCAAKHALRGLVTSLQGENPGFDLRLWSPGYMATDLLPAHSAPRKQGRARSAEEVASLMIQSISDPALRGQNQSID